MVLLTVREFAHLTGKPRREIWTWIDKGGLRVRRIAFRTGVRIELTDEEHALLLAAYSRRAPDRP